MIKVQRLPNYILLLLIITAALFPVSCTVQEDYLTAAPPPQSPPPKPLVNYFTISPQSIVCGQSATILWDIEDAEVITLDPPGEEVPAAGSLQVSPFSSTSYTLTAGNSSGTVTRTQYLKVYSEETSLIGSDPVTGRNEGIGFRWEQLCLATGYQVQIAKDPGFTLIVFDSGVYSPSVSTSPAMLYAPGGVLEAGHTYYWRARVRQTATGESLTSPWSAPARFTISQGVPVAAPYAGVQLLKPANNCHSCPVDGAAFAWTPLVNVEEYSFILAEDPYLKQIVISQLVEGTALACNGILKYDSTYFWQVTASQPAPGEPSAVFSFTTEQRPLPQAVPQQPVPTARYVPDHAWLIVVICVLLIAAVIVFLYLTHRKRHPSGSSTVNDEQQDS